MKQEKFSIAIALKNAAGETLGVKRPSNDDSLPGVWGLPAVTTNKGELPEAAAVRVGKEKLNCTIRSIKTLGIKTKDKGHYLLTLLEFEVELTGGEPDVLQAKTNATKYVEQRWTSDPTLFVEAAQKGSLCSQIFLDSQSFKY